MPPVHHQRKPGVLRRFRQLAGLAPIIVVVALMAVVARSGTETQGGSKNPPPVIRSATPASVDVRS